MPDAGKPVQMRNNKIFGGKVQKRERLLDSDPEGSRTAIRIGHDDEASPEAAL